MLYPAENGILNDALSVDLSNVSGVNNRPYQVISTQTNGLPSGFDAGVRYVHYFDKSNVTVQIIGRDASGNAVQFLNEYLNNSWKGWGKL